MKQLKSKLWVKVTALLLLAVFAVAAVFCGIGTVLLTMENSYLDDGEALRRSANESILRSEIDDVVVFYEDALEMEHQGDNGEYRSFFAERYDIRNTNLRVTIQALGWRGDGSGRYLPLRDDISSVAYWYSDNLEDDCDEFDLENIELT